MTIIYDNINITPEPLEPQKQQKDEKLSDQPLRLVEQKASNTMKLLRSEALEKIDFSSVGKDYAPINLESGKVSYVKIDTLVKLLHISKKLINQAIKKDGNVDGLIDAHERMTKQKFQAELIDKVAGFAQNYADFELFVAIGDLAPTFATKNVTKLFDDPRLKDSKLQKTIIKASRIVKERLEKNITEVHYEKKSTSRDDYGFIIDENNQIYPRGNVLGRGAEKKVPASISVQTLEEYVQPSIKKAIEPYKTVKKEQGILTELQGHKGIPPCYKLIVYRHTTRGKLYEKAVFLQKRLAGDGETMRNKPLDYQIHAIRGCLEGLASMHSKNFVHSDVKFGNMILSNEGEGYITDFGFTVKTGEKRLNVTEAYCAPETINKAKYFKRECLPKEDSFPAGICILQLSNPELFVGSFAKGSIIDPQFHSFPVLKSPFLNYFSKTFEKELNGKKMQELDTTEFTHFFENNKVQFLKSMDSASVTINDLDENQLSAVINEAKVYIEKTYDNPEKEKRLKMLYIADNLLKINPEKRITCKEAASLMAQIDKPVSFMEQIGQWWESLKGK